MANGGNQQTKQTHGESLDLAARAGAAERGDAGYADDRQHEQLRRTKGEHQRADDRNRQRQRHRADQRADQRAHQRRAEGATSLAILRHRMTIDNCGGGDRLAGHTEKH